MSFCLIKHKSLKNPTLAYITNIEEKKINIYLLYMLKDVLYDIKKDNFLLYTNLTNKYFLQIRKHKYILSNNHLFCNKECILKIYDNKYIKQIIPDIWYDTYTYVIKTSNKWNYRSTFPIIDNTNEIKYNTIIDNTIIKNEINKVIISQRKKFLKLLNDKIIKYHETESKNNREENNIDNFIIKNGKMSKEVNSNLEGTLTITDNTISSIISNHRYRK
jgi:hypothetical protein